MQSLACKPNLLFMIAIRNRSILPLYTDTSLELHVHKYQPSGTRRYNPFELELILMHDGYKPIGLYGKFILCGILGIKQNARLLRNFASSRPGIDINPMLFKKIFKTPSGDIIS